jgi:hypothetical protein
MVPKLKIFCGFCAKGQEFLYSRAEGNHDNANTKVEIHYLLPKIQASLVQTNKKAYLAQTGDG